MYWDTIDILRFYCIDNYALVNFKIGLNKKKFEQRCYENSICNDILLACMDKPSIDPTDIIEDWLIYIYAILQCIELKPKTLNIYTIQKNALNKIHKYLNDVRKGNIKR